MGFLGAFRAEPLHRRYAGRPAHDLGDLRALIFLAAWFGLHVLFGEVHAIEGFGMSLDIPGVATINPAALLLMLAATGGCSAAGALYFLAVGAIA